MEVSILQTGITNEKHHDFLEDDGSAAYRNEKILIFQSVRQGHVRTSQQDRWQLDPKDAILERF